MHSGILDVLADAVFDYLTFPGDCVKFYLVGLGHKLGDDHRMILADL